MSFTKFDRHAFLSSDASLSDLTGEVVHVGGELELDPGEELLQVHFLVIQGKTVVTGSGRVTAPANGSTPGRWDGEASIVGEGGELRVNTTVDPVPHDLRSQAVGIAVTRKRDPAVTDEAEVGLGTFTWCVPVKLHADASSAQAARLADLAAAPTGG